MQMRTHPLNPAACTISHYELRDRDGSVLAETDSHAEGRRLLQAFVLTSSGREEEVVLASVAIDGRLVSSEDIFDIEVAELGTA
jgi:hypothetical protein